MRLWLGALALALGGCGGGSDDAADAVAANTLSAPSVPATGTPAASGASGSAGTSGGGTAGIAAPQASTAPQPTPGPARDTDGNPFNDPAPPAGTPIAKQDCGITNLARDIIQLMNVERARGASCGTRGIYQPTGTLTWNTQLEGAAIGHSQDMSANDLFSHIGSAGQNLAVRVDATGYQWTLLGENIAAGFDTPAATVQAWMASDGHCANVMNPQFQDVALACVPGTAATHYRNYWTLDFGKPR